MKLSLLLISFLASYANAFSPQCTAASKSTTALNLFGSGKTGENKGPNMMDQLAMFKKAQEMAQKKRELDTELNKMNFQGSGADGKVKVSFKYTPNNNPMDPNPDYDAQTIEFDDAFFASSSPDEIAAAVKEAIMNGIEQTNIAVAEKYAILQKDLMEAFGQKGN